MSKEHFHEIRTNVNYSVDYTTMKLVPQVELIFLNSYPKYAVVTKKGSAYIERGHGLTETRVFCSLKQLNELLGELQATAARLQQFDQLGHGLNEVIEVNRKAHEKK